MPGRREKQEPGTHPPLHARGATSRPGDGARVRTYRSSCMSFVLYRNPLRRETKDSKTKRMKYLPSLLLFLPMLVAAQPGSVIRNPGMSVAVRADGSYEIRDNAAGHPVLTSLVGA